MPPCGALLEVDQALLAVAEELPGKVRAAMERLAFHEALDEILKMVRAADGYIDHQAPWALRKTDIERMNTVLRVLVETIRTIGFLLQPFMPGAMENLLTQVGVPAAARHFSDLETTLVDGAGLPAPSGVFPRYVEAA